MGLYTSIRNPCHRTTYDQYLESNARRVEFDTVHTRECDFSSLASKVVQSGQNFVSNINRIPHYSHADLTKWYQDPHLKKRIRVLQYYRSRCFLNLEILEAQELVARVWCDSFVR